jgi:hypothetical protein
MKVRMPRGWEDLKPSDKDKIIDVLDEQVEKNVNYVLDIYLKMSCEVLNRAFGFGEKRLYEYLGNYKRVFREHRKLVKRGEQLPELDKRMRKIFRKKGYPDEFFKEMLTGWSINTNKGAETDGQTKDNYYHS